MWKTKWEFGTILLWYLVSSPFNHRKSRREWLWQESSALERTTLMSSWNTTWWKKASLLFMFLGPVVQGQDDLYWGFWQCGHLKCNVQKRILHQRVYKQSPKVEGETQNLFHLKGDSQDSKKVQKCSYAFSINFFLGETLVFWITNFILRSPLSLGCIPWPLGPLRLG